MISQDFTVQLTTKQTPRQVFDVIKNVRSWWSGLFIEEITGDTKAVNDVFEFRAGDGAHYSQHKLIETTANKKLVWLTTESNLSFLKDSGEWKGTKLIFEITEQGSNTLLSFTHEGLTADKECYDSCAPAWTMYLQQKLLPLLQDAGCES